jgi:hypothetical protein
VFYLLIESQNVSQGTTCVLSGEATNINFIFFGLTRLGREPAIYRTRGELANHYTAKAVYKL